MMLMVLVSSESGFGDMRPAAACLLDRPLPFVGQASSHRMRCGDLTTRIEPTPLNYLKLSQKFIEPVPPVAGLRPFRAAAPAQLESYQRNLL